MSPLQRLSLLVYQHFFPQLFQLFLCKLPVQPQTTLYKPSDLHLTTPLGPLAGSASSHMLETCCCSADSQYPPLPPTTTASVLLTQVHFHKFPCSVCNGAPHLLPLYQASGSSGCGPKNQNRIIFAALKPVMFKFR